MNHLHHPDLHPAVSDWSEDQVLHIASAYSNPFRWHTRRELANDFRRHIEHMPNAKLHMIELAYGDRPFEVTAAGAGDIQLRSADVLFLKENLLNLAVRSFPADWRYGAIVDADFHFTRHDVALETIHQLQHYDFVQMFSSYHDLSGRTLGAGHRLIPSGNSNGFVYNYIQNGYKLPPGYADGGWKVPAVAGGYTGMMAGLNPVGATGGAWAFRRSAFDAVGGLMDRCILGHGDWFMAFGMVGELARDMRITGYHSTYQEYIAAWQDRATVLRKNVGYVDCHALHMWHGPKNRRGYSTRDEILVREKYCPVRDVYPDWQGVLQLTPGKPGLRDAIRAYFLSRSEDVPHMEPNR
jgi:hypothetical protein